MPLVTMTAPETAGQVGKRLVFQENMRLVALPDKTADGRAVKRYMSQRAPWVPGIDLPKGLRGAMRFRGAAFGGHVYCQSGLAASRAFAETRPVSGQPTQDPRSFGIHVRSRLCPPRAPPASPSRSDRCPRPSTVISPKPEP